MVPKRWRASLQAATAPGTETDSIPVDGTSDSFRSVKNAGVALLPARPLPFKA
jgi:hypothetical protein